MITLTTINCHSLHFVHLIFRVLGSLLSAHLIIKDPLQPFGDMVPTNYDDELLLLAHDMANRLLAAFEQSVTQIPYPRVCILSFPELSRTKLAALGRLEKRESGIRNTNGNRNRNRNRNRNSNRNGKRNLYKSRDNIYLNLS